MDISMSELSFNQKNYIKLKDYYKKYRDEHKETQKEYYEKHKEGMKEYHVNRYLKIKEDMLKKEKCVCGASVCSSAMKRHTQTVKHQFIMNQRELAEIKGISNL